MSARDDLFSRLRAETQDLHSKVEGLVPDVSERATVHSYREFLACMWGFHAALEPRLAEVPGLSSVVVDLSLRKKADLLERDLVQLGAVRSELMLCQRVPPLDSLEQALGALYVLEGSTLGGQFVLRQLSRAIPDVLARAHAFLGCYGTRTGEMWSTFRRQLCQAVTPDAHDAVVHAARATFQAMCTWLSRRAAVSWQMEKHLCT